MWKYLTALVLFCSCFFAVKHTNAQYLDVVVNIPAQLTLRNLDNPDRNVTDGDEAIAYRTKPGGFLEWFEITNNENSVVSVDIVYNSDKKLSAYFINGLCFDPRNATVLTSDHNSFYLQNQYDINRDEKREKYRAWIGIPTQNILELKLEYH